MNQSHESSPTLEVLDLREHQDESLLQAAYRDLYVPSFPMTDEAEDPSVWRPLLWGEVPPPPKPILRVLVAGRELRNAASRVLAGFVFTEAFRESGCGLLTYLAVAPSFRGQGVAARLLAEAEQRLQEDMRRHGRTLQAVFGEINNPNRVSPGQDSIDPRDRVRIFDRLGFRWVPIPYVQPALGPNQAKCYFLDLMVMPLQGVIQEKLPGSVITSFLNEFYRSLGVGNPEHDPDYCRTVAAVTDPVVLIRPD
jgi:GNAT superfamily N-acetyltransferase